MIDFTPYYDKLEVSNVDELKELIFRNPGKVLEVVMSLRPKQLPVNTYYIKWCNNCNFKGMLHMRQDLCPICIKKLDKNNYDSVDKLFDIKFANWQDTKNFILQFKDSELKEQLLTKTFEEFSKITPAEEFDAMGVLLTYEEYQKLLNDNIPEEKQKDHIKMIEKFSRIDKIPEEKITCEMGDEVLVGEAICG